MITEMDKVFLQMALEEAEQSLNENTYPGLNIRACSLF